MFPEILLEGLRIAPMTAIESAPLSKTSDAFSKFIPPMATSGKSPIIARAAFTPFKPTTASGFSFDEV